jgi:hypothetical protein
MREQGPVAQEAVLFGIKSTQRDERTRGHLLKKRSITLLAMQRLREGDLVAALACVRLYAKSASTCDIGETAKKLGGAGGDEARSAVL